MYAHVRVRVAFLAYKMLKKKTKTKKERKKKETKKEKWKDRVGDLIREKKTFVKHYTRTINIEIFGAALQKYSYYTTDAEMKAQNSREKQKKTERYEIKAIGTKDPKERYG